MTKRANSIKARTYKDWKKKNYENLSLKISNNFNVWVCVPSAKGLLSAPSLCQWFSTGVPWESDRYAASYHFPWPLDLFKHLWVPPNSDIVDQGCREAKKKVLNNCSIHLKTIFFLNTNKYFFSFERSEAIFHPEREGAHWDKCQQVISEPRERNKRAREIIDRNITFWKKNEKSKIIF